MHFTSHHTSNQIVSFAYKQIISNIQDLISVIFRIEINTFHVHIKGTHFAAVQCRFVKPKKTVAKDTLVD